MQRTRTAVTAPKAMRAVGALQKTGVRCGSLQAAPREAHTVTPGAIRRRQQHLRDDQEIGALAVPDQLEEVEGHDYLVPFSATTGWTRDMRQAG